MLDGVKASSIRSNATSVQYTAARLSSGQSMDSFSLTTAIDYTREIVNWIDLYEHADVELADMTKVKKELQRLLESFLQIHTELAFKEENDRYQPYEDEDEFREP